MRGVAKIWMLGLVACGEPDALHVAVVTSSDAAHLARYAQERINGSGGIDGARFEVHIIEEGNGAQGHASIAVAESLAADPRILAVIGHRGSTTSIVASQVYNARGVPQIAPSSSAPLYRMAGPYSFRLVAGDEHQARFIAAHVRSMTPAPRVALLYVNDDYGQALYRVLREEIRHTDVPVVYETPYLKGARFTAAAELAAAVTAARPTLLLWLGTPSELAVILDDIREGLPELRVLGSDGLSGAAGHAVLGRHLRDGDQFVSFFNPLNAGPEYDELAARFRSVADHKIGAEEALTYDAVTLVAEALRHGTATRLGVRNYLQSLGGERPPYVGLSGPVSFNEHGDAPPSYVMLEISGSGVKVVR